MKNTLYSFTEDVGRLYCLTQNHKLEDIFLRLSQSQDDDFSKWFSRNRNHIKPQLQNPEVADLLDALIETRKVYYTISIVDFVDMIQGANKKIAGGIGRNVGNIRALESMLSDPDLQPMLSPYRDIITASQNFTESPTIPVNVIADDLKTIRSLYEVFLNEFDQLKSRGDGLKPKKLTLKEKKTQLFSYLLQRFSREVADAAERSGMTDFAQAVRNEGVLAKPSIIKDYYPAVSRESTFASRIMSDRLIKRVTKNIAEERFEAAYEDLKEQIMEFKRVVTEADLAKIHLERERERDVARYMGQEVRRVEIKPLQVSDAGWLRPGVIEMIAYILDALYREIH